MSTDPMAQTEHSRASDAAYVDAWHVYLQARDAWAVGGRVGPEPTRPVPPHVSGSFPRRNRLDRFTPAERVLFDAVQTVERVGAHPLLTDAVLALGDARRALADYVDLTAAEARLREA